MYVLYKVYSAVAGPVAVLANRPHLSGMTTRQYGSLSQPEIGFVALSTPCWFLFCSCSVVCVLWSYFRAAMVAYTYCHCS